MSNHVYDEKSSKEGFIAGYSSTEEQYKDLAIEFAIFTAMLEYMEHKTQGYIFVYKGKRYSPPQLFEQFKQKYEQRNKS